MPTRKSYICIYCFGTSCFINEDLIIDTNCIIQNVMKFQAETSATSRMDNFQNKTIIVSCFDYCIRKYLHYLSAISESSEAEMTTVAEMYVINRYDIYCFWCCIQWNKESRTVSIANCPDCHFKIQLLRKSNTFGVSYSNKSIFSKLPFNFT